MKGLLDNQTIEVPCPKCSHKTKKTIGWLKTNDHFVCTCNTRIDLKSDQFRRTIAEAETMLRKLTQKF